MQYLCPLKFHNLIFHQEYQLLLPDAQLGQSFSIGPDSRATRKRDGNAGVFSYAFYDEESERVVSAT